MDPLTMTMVACVAALMKVKGNGYDLGSLFTTTSSDRQKKPSGAKDGTPTPLVRTDSPKVLSPLVPVIPCVVASSAAVAKGVLNAAPLLVTKATGEAKPSQLPDSGVVPLPLTPIGSVKKPKSTPQSKKAPKSVQQTHQKVARLAAKQSSEPVIDEQVVTAVVEKLKVELPSLLEQFNNAPKRTIVSETYDAVYRSQIVAAQQFLNENRSADLSRVKCLLHKLLPHDYFDHIEQLREHQDPQTIVNIMGGQNIIAPGAKKVCQDNHPKKGEKGDAEMQEKK